MLCDEHLMVKGSSAYINSINTVSEIIPTHHAINYNNVVINHNVDYVSVGSPFFVREAGVYIAFSANSVDTACQFTLFINGVMQPNTCSGTNSGAGQMVQRYMLELQKDDQVTIRNHITSANSLTSLANVGGFQVGNSATFLLMKISPLCKPKWAHKYEHVIKKKKKFFNKIKEALVDDDELMVKGFDVTGTFSNTVAQIVPLEADLNFSQAHNMKGLSWNPVNPSQVVVEKEGIYKLFFMLTDQTASQFSLAVNGNPVETTTNGTNKGSGQLTSRSIIPLCKNDVVTIRNHSSQNGSIQLTDHAGGANASLSVILTMFKIAPYKRPLVKPVPKCVEDKLECLYYPLRQYLVHKQNLQVAGAKAYVSLTNSLVQTVPQNAPFYWSTPAVKADDIYFRPGDTTMVVQESGVYDIFCDIATNEPLQICLFVNGVADSSTLTGRDSGGNRCLMRQFINAKRGDVLSIRNFLSTSATVTTIANAGGNNIGNNAVFMAFLLHPC